MGSKVYFKMSLRAISAAIFSDHGRFPRSPRRPRNDSQRLEAGQSLLEVIVAMTAGILVVAALTYAVIFSLRNANFAKTSSQATKLAQEGIERVRIGRDRNSSVSVIGVSTVDSWSGSGPIWNYRITTLSGCDNPVSGGGDGGKCYFNVDPTTGALTNIGFDFVPSPTVPLPSLTESISSANQVFRRMILLSDDTNYQTQKKVTAIVQWTDFSGTHQSMLTTILREL